MYLSGAMPLPNEYDFMELDEPAPRAPGDFAERVVIALDCANGRRVGPDRGLPRAGTAGRRHRSSSRQHALRAVNLVVGDASSTGEILAATCSRSSASGSPRISPRPSTSRSSPTRGASSTRTRRRRHCGSPPIWSRRGRTSIGSSRASTRTSRSRSSSSSRALERARVYEGGRVIVSVPAKTTSTTLVPRSPSPRGSSTTCARSRAQTSSR